MDTINIKDVKFSVTDKTIFIRSENSQSIVDIEKFKKSPRTEIFNHYFSHISNKGLYDCNLTIFSVATIISYYNIGSIMQNAYNSIQTYNLSPQCYIAPPPIAPKVKKSKIKQAINKVVSTFCK